MSTFLIPGPSGQLEAAFAEAASSFENVLSRPTLIVCHPHPLFGGTMDNKVVTTTARAAADLGFATLRFNFRGVGRSEGVYDNAIGERDDLIAAIDWLQQEKGLVAGLVLAGFSFGSYVAASVAQVQAALQLLSIAPPVHHFDFSTLHRAQCPWIVIQGEADEIVPPEAVYDFCLTRDITLNRLPETGHFFHGKLGELKTIVQACLSPLVTI